MNNPMQSHRTPYPFQATASESEDGRWGFEYIAVCEQETVFRSRFVCFKSTVFKKFWYDVDHELADKALHAFGLSLMVDGQKCDAGDQERISDHITDCSTVVIHMHTDDTEQSKVI